LSVPRTGRKFLYHKIPKQGCHFFNLKSVEDYYKEWAAPMGREDFNARVAKDAKNEEKIRI
jgi:hypothetical protein